MYLSSEYPAKVYAQVTADASGAYAFEGVDAPQAYVVEVRGATGPLVAQTIVLEASQSATLNLVVPAVTDPGSTGTDTGTGTGTGTP